MKEYQLKTKMKSYQWDELSEEQREVVAIAKEQIRIAIARTAISM